MGFELRTMGFCLKVSSLRTERVQACVGLCSACLARTSASRSRYTYVVVYTLLSWRMSLSSAE